MKICLTANSGGHINEVLQLKSYYQKHEYFFITDESKMTQHLAESDKVYFVQKFIFKEVVQKFQLLRPINNIFQSLKIFLKEKPDAVITTGAGTSFGAIVIGKLLRKKIIFVESAARVNTTSTFGKIAGKLADHTLVQWEDTRKLFKDSENIGLIFPLDTVTCDEPTPIKKIFLTAGTYKIPFSRMFKEVDKLVERKEVKAEVVGQIGTSDYIPNNYQYFDYCDQPTLHNNIETSDLVICQGGCGSIMDSLLKGKRVIAIPRLVEHGEYFDDHQVELIKELERLGLILAVYGNTEDLGKMIQQAESFKPNIENLKAPVFDEYLTKYLS
ncbi:PssD/Cps14F family polysaccharide biosynthesis glycosyltransferase [Vibrio sp. TRT 21S02]|uniref:PssD/Cps14F family polysaccharide biosynthesis glycosyltransferase n=1 Tax=unclassified Vibrio TaxID=2614977 RepID=UPI003CE8E0AA